MIKMKLIYKLSLFSFPCLIGSYPGLLGPLLARFYRFLNVDQIPRFHKQFLMLSLKVKNPMNMTAVNIW